MAAGMPRRVGCPTPSPAAIHRYDDRAARKADQQLSSSSARDLHVSHADGRGVFSIIRRSGVRLHGHRPVELAGPKGLDRPSDPIDDHAIAIGPG